MTIRLAKSLFLEPEIKAGSQIESLNRKQGIPSDLKLGIDSLSPGFTEQVSMVTPGIQISKKY